MDEITVYLIDDHAVMRRGLASLLGTQHGLRVVGDAGDAALGIREAAALKPDVVIMDLMMPQMDGVDATRRLKAECPETHVLILTTFGTADGLGHALAAGASGALVKTAELPELLAAIRATAAGGRTISPEIEQILADDPPIPELTPRQAEVLASVTRGFTNEDIARQLGLSLATVKDYLNTTFAKIGAANRAEAVAIALRKHLLKF